MSRFLIRSPFESRHFRQFLVVLYIGYLLSVTLCVSCGVLYLDYLLSMLICDVRCLGFSHRLAVFTCSYLAIC